VNAIAKFWQLAVRFPRSLAAAWLLITLEALMAGATVLVMAPLADLLLERPESQWLGITRKIRSLIEYMGVSFTLTSVTMLMWVSMLMGSVTSVYLRNSTTKIKLKLVRHFIKEAYESMFAASWEFFPRVKKGGLINTFMREINKVGTAFQTMATMLSGIVKISATVATPLWIEPVLVAVCVAGIAIVLIPFLLFGRMSYGIGQQNLSSSKKYSSFVRESLDGAKEVLAYGRARDTTNAVLSKYDDYAATTVKSEYLRMMLSQMYEPVGLLVIIAMLHIAQKQNIAVAGLSVVLWGMLRVIPLFKQLILQKHQMNNLLPSYDNLLKLLERARQHRDDTGNLPFEGLNDEIQVRDVTYTYGREQIVLDRASLSIRKGEVVAIMGDSGSGKSTLVDIIIGLLVPGQGEVRIDGVPLREYDQSTWRQRIGLVTQKPNLFDRSIRENLLWSTPEATEEEVWEACRLAGAEVFIRELPRQLDTKIGDNAVRLSGGQAQRLALARALVRKPELLILDEATNALDLATERDIVNRVYALRGKMTILVVTHRPSTSRNADAIYVLDRGRILKERAPGTVIAVDNPGRRV
jgi:ABC-type multidrug transport system fused ATPase/permease subunit